MGGEVQFAERARGVPSHGVGVALAGGAVEGHGRRGGKYLKRRASSTRPPKKKQKHARNFRFTFNLPTRDQSSSPP